jgi:hypothetical protein
MITIPAGGGVSACGTITLTTRMSTCTFDERQPRVTGADDGAVVRVLRGAAARGRVGDDRDGRIVRPGVAGRAGRVLLVGQGRRVAISAGSV